MYRYSTKNMYQYSTKKIIFNIIRLEPFTCTHCDMRSVPLAPLGLQSNFSLVAAASATRQAVGTAFNASPWAHAPQGRLWEEIPFVGDWTELDWLYSLLKKWTHGYHTSITHPSPHRRLSCPD